MLLRTLRSDHLGRIKMLSNPDEILALKAESDHNRQLHRWLHFYLEESPSDH
uniref:Uncharacterized protein n=1 Tax=Arundo donax TaxID=35708 RepID=A0A0A9BYE2_ARUDO